MDVKPGYKQTEVGVIPEDWEVKPADDLCRVNQGLQIPISNRLKTPSSKSRKYITIQYLNEAKELEYIDDYTPSVCCNENDVLMTRTGNTGIVVTGVEGVFHNNFFKINYDKKLLQKEYLVNYLSQERLQRLILEKAGTSTIPDLNHSDFYSIPIIVPPLPEQEAIAEALSDVDKLLGSLEKFIAKKRAIKQAAMQQLLTGKTRLQGFSGEWETRRIGDFTDCTAGGTPSTFLSEYWGGAIRWMNSGELNKKIVHDVEGRITERGLRESSTKIVPPRCVLVGLAGQGKTRGTVAINTVELCTNQSIAAIYPNESFVPEYLYHNLDARYEELRGLSTGDGGRGGLNLRIILSIPVLFPRVDEQLTIATVLSDMDTEIAALEQRRDKTRAIKQGMMQQLLTGRVRLVKSPSTAEALKC